MREFRKILIANRGEIAVRIARSAHKLGYSTVAVFSDADADTLHVASCDESVRIGPAPASQSYLQIERIIDAAKRTGADAIHPGYGFLSENAAFAQACETADIVFVGPPVEAIRLMGSKRLSKIAMIQAGVPCIPGYEGAAQDDETLLTQAERIGLPLMVKASAGGGGRGMRLVTDQMMLLESFRSARSEATSAFGSGELILEKAVLRPRHIEVQVFADQHGNYLHLGERDCSIQRRHQKVVEEAPSAFVTPDLRQRMGEAAVAAARRCSYVGAGTVEFLVDAERKFYFLEMNTRLQVEHPVTELVTGLDLVELQLRVAAGESLPLTQDQVRLLGHAIEVRLYAEDPRADFLPQTGVIERLHWPAIEGLRVDTGVREGQAVTAFYDPMLAKLIAYGSDRRTAARRLAKSLEELSVLGVTTNRAFLAEILRNAAFLDGEATTAFIAEQMTKAHSLGPQLAEAKAPAMAGLLLYCSGKPLVTAWAAGRQSGTRLALMGADAKRQEIQIRQVAANVFEIGSAQQKYVFEIRALEAEYVEIEIEGLRGSARYLRRGPELLLSYANQNYRFEDVTFAAPEAAVGGGSGKLLAPMDGLVVALFVEPGTRVKAGDPVLAVEAMKMESQIRAPFDGLMDSLFVKKGQQVKSRQVLAMIVADSAS